MEDNLDDLSMMLGLAPDSPESIQLVQLVQSNVNTLDEVKNEEENNAGYFLEKYTNLQNKIDETQKKIDEFKLKHLEIFNELDKLENEISEVKDLQSATKDKLTQSMEDSSLKNIANNRFKITFVASSIREIFDKDKFMKKYPVLYKDFLKTSNVKSYIKISEVK